MCATVAGNRIEEIEKDTFKGLDHLRVLDLDRNRIYFIDARAFAAVPELRCLRLAGNNIRVIYEDTFISVPHLQVTYTLHTVRAWIRTKLASLGDETQVWIWEFATLPSLSHRFPSLSFLHFLPPFSFLSSSSVPSPQSPSFQSITLVCREVSDMEWDISWVHPWWRWVGPRAAGLGRCAQILRTRFVGERLL